MSFLADFRKSSYTRIEDKDLPYRVYTLFKQADMAWNAADALLFERGNAVVLAHLGESLSGYQAAANLVDEASAEGVFLAQQMAIVNAEMTQVKKRVSQPVVPSVAAATTPIQRPKKRRRKHSSTTDFHKGRNLKVALNFLEKFRASHYRGLSPAKPHYEIGCVFKAADMAWHAAADLQKRHGPAAEVNKLIAEATMHYQAVQRLLPVGSVEHKFLKAELRSIDVHLSSKEPSAPIGSSPLFNKVEKKVRFSGGVKIAEVVPEISEAHSAQLLAAVYPDVPSSVVVGARTFFNFMSGLHHDERITELYAAQGLPTFSVHPIPGDS